jgi:hypothetical protein
MSTKQKKTPEKSLTALHKKSAAKTAVTVAQPKTWDFDALNRREDAQSQSFRDGEVRAGRAWPFLTNG